MVVRFHTFVFVLVLFLVVLFAAVNWPLFLEVSPINLLFATVMAPLGLIMLAIFAGLTVLYLVLLASVQTEALLGSRRADRELDEARKVALSAEESRIRDLREDVGERLARIEDRLEDVQQRLGTERRRETIRSPDHVSDRVDRPDHEIEREIKES